jgi:hypothetical protein
LPWKSFVPTRKTVADHTNTAKSVTIMLAKVCEMTKLSDKVDF